MTQGSPRPVEKFLGAAAAAGGPFALLALAPEDCTQELIIVQLQRQLKKLAAHAEASSHEADEVRLALHAAAAQLLEGVPRDGVGLAVSEPRVATAGATRAVESGSAGTVSPGMLAMERDIVATIAQYGGWNAQCLHRLALIAHSRGVSQEDFLGAIDAFRRVPSGSAASSASREGAADSPGGVGGVVAQGAAGGSTYAAAAEERDPTPRLILGGLVAMVILLALLGGAIYLVAALTSGGGEKPVAVTPGTVGEDGRVGPDVTENGSPVQGTRELFPTMKEGANKGRETAPVPVPGDVAALLKECRDVGVLAGTDPARAQARFEAAMRAAEDLWVRATQDQIAGLQDAVVEYMYRVGRGSERHAAIEACVGGVRALPATGIEAAQVRAAVFAAGMVARLSRERELPGDMVDSLAALMRQSFFRSMSVGDASFRGGATSACVELVRRLTPGDGANPVQEAKVLECWKAWLECVEACGLEHGLRDRLVLQALDSQLRGAPEPTRNKAVFDGVSALSQAFEWKGGEESRARLLRWFDDPEVSEADLHAVTLAVAGKGLLAGVDASMVLSAAAGEAARSELRDRYREAWGGGGESTRAASSAKFLEAATAALARQSVDEPASRLAGALWCSRLSEAAELIWFGRDSGAMPSEPQVQATGTAALPAGVMTITTTEGVSSSSWAVRYLAQRTRIPERKALLGEYRGSSGMESMLDAWVIVGEAVRGSPYEIRNAAAALVVDHAGEAVFVNALLEESSTMPLTRDNSLLVAQVSRGSVLSVRNPSFRVVARRSLVERLLELLSAGGELGQVDAIGEKIAESYHARAKVAMDAAGRDATTSLAGAGTGTDSEEDGSGASGAVPAVERSARQLRLAMEVEARRHLPSGKEPRTLEEMRQDRVGRALAAQGRMQQCVAEQGGIVDLLAYLVVSESPSQKGSVEEVLEAYASARRGAGHIAEQVEAGERAMLRLWMLRLQGEGA